MSPSYGEELYFFYDDHQLWGNMGSFVPDFICSLLFGQLIQLRIRRKNLNSVVIR
jgi:hypothetical protein